MHTRTPRRSIGVVQPLWRFTRRVYGPWHALSTSITVASLARSMSLASRVGSDSQSEGLRRLGIPLPSCTIRTHHCDRDLHVGTPDQNLPGGLCPWTVLRALVHVMMPETTFWLWVVFEVWNTPCANLRSQAFEIWMTFYEKAPGLKPLTGFTGYSVFAVGRRAMCTLLHQLTNSFAWDLHIYAR